jgi:hypothetical protein
MLTAKSVKSKQQLAVRIVRAEKIFLKGRKKAQKMKKVTNHE